MNYIEITKHVGFPYWPINTNRPANLVILARFLSSEVGTPRKDDLEFLNDAIFNQDSMGFNLAYFRKINEIMHINLDGFEDEFPDVTMLPKELWNLILAWSNIVQTYPDIIYLTEENNTYHLYSGDDYELTTLANGNEMLVKKTKTI